MLSPVVWISLPNIFKVIVALLDKNYLATCGFMNHENIDSMMKNNLRQDDQVFPKLLTFYSEMVENFWNIEFSLVEKLGRLLKT